jgi:hypothetical protein
MNAATVEFRNAIVAILNEKISARQTRIDFSPSPDGRDKAATELADLLRLRERLTKGPECCTGSRNGQ